MTKYFDTDQVELKNGDLIDLGQTVNGCRTFLINCLELLDVRYYPNTTLKYEYSVEDLLGPSKLLGYTEFKIIKRSLPFFLTGGGVRGILALETLERIKDEEKEN